LIAISGTTEIAASGLKLSAGPATAAPAACRWRGKKPRAVLALTSAAYSPIDLPTLTRRTMTLKEKITEDMKAAMRSGDKHRLGVIRLILAALKQREVDERIVLDDAQVLSVLEKMLKQRRDSVEQYTAAAREDLATVEREEMEVIQVYLPAALSEAEIDAIVSAAISSSGASGTKDMGKVIGVVRPQVTGRADMGQISELIKRKLAG
jgi:uncharacterized protein YqeY